METNIESHLIEKRVFKPAKDFSKKARIKSLVQYRKMYRESMRRPDAFWMREAKELVWRKPWKRVLDWKAPFAKWFVGGQLNVSENCLDRHLDGARRNKAAIIWEGEPGERRTLTYQQLHSQVCRFANVLKRNKIKKGECVLIYMPMIPEAAIAVPSIRIVPRRRSTASIRFSSSTRVARPETQRACCTRRAAISLAFIRRRNTSSTPATRTCSGAPPMSAGSPATATLFTDR